MTSQPHEKKGVRDVRDYKLHKAQADAKMWEEVADEYRAALGEIASMPVVQLNPDGVDQAAETMRLVAREAIGDVVPNL
jgi:hypothetical protein